MGRELRAAGVTVKVAEGIPIPLPPPPRPTLYCQPWILPTTYRNTVIHDRPPPPPLQLKELAHNNESMVL